MVLIKKFETFLLIRNIIVLRDLIDLSCEVENQIKNDTCLAEIEHHDTHIVETSLATNLRQDVVGDDEIDNMLKEKANKFDSFSCLPH